MMSAARGAEQFYTIEHHASRKEGLELARELDLKAAEAWVGHPYVDLVKTTIFRFILLFFCLNYGKLEFFSHKKCNFSCHPGKQVLFNWIYLYNIRC